MLRATGRLAACFRVGHGVRMHGTCFNRDWNRDSDLKPRTGGTPRRVFVRTGPDCAARLRPRARGPTRSGSDPSPETRSRGPRAGGGGQINPAVTVCIAPASDSMPELRCSRPPEPEAPEHLAISSRSTRDQLGPQSHAANPSRPTDPWPCRIRCPDEARMPARTRGGASEQARPGPARGPALIPARTARCWSIQHRGRNRPAAGPAGRAPRPARRGPARCGRAPA
jgi:hypothetical protein